MINWRLFPVNIGLDEDVSKTSWWDLFSSSSEEVLKTSSRRLDQDKFIHLSHSSSEDVLFKTNMLALLIRLQYVFKTYGFKTYSRRLKNVFKTSSRRLAKTSCQDISSKHLQSVLQKRLQDIFKTPCKDAFKVFWRRIIRLNCLPRPKICLSHTSAKFKVASVISFSINPWFLVFHFTTSFSGCLQRSF